MQNPCNIQDRLLSRLVQEAEAIPMGDPLAESTKLGPLTSQEQFETVTGFVERARASGARVLCGGPLHVD